MYMAFHVSHSDLHSYGHQHFFKPPVVKPCFVSSLVQVCGPQSRARCSRGSLYRYMVPLPGTGVPTSK
ncbi:hypothetical protein SKAU_G00200990 [Synaphobranchus kaupii]|uniref:Uncharacterized protein n=1 Tax=Synaphobranchus kaupii TaxID=118154 RepID=A0A9Q1FFU0_SYNKA|nr:hypothetical protein SKAU_G00200990 [Synaphobranchus kaupii]